LIRAYSYIDKGNEPYPGQAKIRWLTQSRQAAKKKFNELCPLCAFAALREIFAVYLTFS
jgi:hypothetical protein